MSKSIDANVRREDTDTFVASVSTKFDNMQDAVKWSEDLAEKARVSNSESSRIDEQPETASSTESGQITPHAASTDVANG